MKRLRADRHCFDEEYSPPGLCNVGAAIAAAGVVASTASSLHSANVAKGAANRQAAAAQTASENQLQAAREANQMQWAMNQQANLNQAPYMQAGQMGLSALTGALFGTPNQPTAGYGNQPAFGPSGPGVQQDFTQLPNQYGGQAVQNQPGAPMNNAPGRATIQPVNPNTPEGRRTAQGINLGQFAGQIAGQQGQVGQGGQAAPPPGSPPGVANTPTGITTPGTTATPIGGLQNYGASQGQLNAAGGAFSGQLGRQFSNADLNAQLAPNYQFQLGQGLQALKASRAATGMLQTGQGLKDINDYAQNQAAGAYQQAFQNWNTQQNQLYTRLQGLISPGSAAAGQMASINAQTGANMAQTGMAGAQRAADFATSGAAAQAAGQVGSANAIAGGIGSAATGAMNAYNIYSRNNPSTPTTTTGMVGNAGYMASDNPAWANYTGG